jgi:hypothetical protein
VGEEDPGDQHLRPHDRHAATDRDGLPSFRVVVIDPDLNMVQAEDSAGTVLTDTIDHVIASYVCR